MHAYSQFPDQGSRLRRERGNPANSVAQSAVLWKGCGHPRRFASGQIRVVGQASRFMTEANRLVGDGRCPGKRASTDGRVPLRGSKRGAQRIRSETWLRLMQHQPCMVKGAIPKGRLAEWQSAGNSAATGLRGFFCRRSDYRVARQAGGNRTSGAHVPFDAVNDRVKNQRLPFSSTSSG